jgi:hypothetical protein
LAQTVSPRLKDVFGVAQSAANNSTVSPVNAIDGEAENQDFVRAKILEAVSSRSTFDALRRTELELTEATGTAKTATAKMSSASAEE